jgi:hypothetical protein
MIDMDRFGRRDSLATGAWLDRLRTHGLRYIITATQRFDLYNALDRTLIALGSDFTREPELRTKSNHVLNGMAERARQGLWMGGPIPYGYRLGADGRLILGPEEEQEVVRWIFATYASGRLTANGIARELNARGVKPRWSKSGRWSRNTVLKLLASRTYLGCIVWGEQLVGRYHRLVKGMVVPREDKHDREQYQLRKGLKHLPVRLAAEEDCIVCPDAHPALIGQEIFHACQWQRQRNQEDHSAPRGQRGKPGLKGNVWPLAGQMKCGHCAQPVWTLPVGDNRGKRKGTYIERARVCCCERRKDPSACPESGTAPYLEVLARVVNLLREKLASPGAVEEMTRELERQLAEQAHTGQGARQRLTARLTALDNQIATATRNLLQFPEDLRPDAFEALRSLKAERDAAGQELRDLDTAERQAKAIDPETFKATLAAVASLSPTWETREEAELLRATLRDLVAEVRIHYRDRREGDPRPSRGIAPKRVIGRVEVDLTPSFADLLNVGSRSSIPPRTW